MKLSAVLCNFVIDFNYKCVQIILQFHPVYRAVFSLLIKDFRKFLFKPTVKSPNKSGAGDLAFGKAAHSITDYGEQYLAVVCHCLFD